MNATGAIMVERGIYYAVLNILVDNDVPKQMWPLLIDSVAGRIKDEAITVLAVLADESAKQDKDREPEEEDSNGEHRARD